MRCCHHTDVLVAICTSVESTAAFSLASRLRVRYRSVHASSPTGRLRLRVRYSCPSLTSRLRLRVRYSCPSLTSRLRLRVRHVQWLLLHSLVAYGYECGLCKLSGLVGAGVRPGPEHLVASIHHTDVLVSLSTSVDYTVAASLTSRLRLRVRSLQACRPGRSECADWTRAPCGFQSPH